MTVNKKFFELSKVDLNDDEAIYAWAREAWAVMAADRKEKDE